MGVDITAYRAAIGIFYAATHISWRLLIISLNYILLLQLLCALSSFVFLALRCLTKIDQFAFYKIFLLMICMDINPNPGPNDTNSSHTIDIMHLNTHSIRNKLNFISNLSDTYQVVCFSETHLDDIIDSNSLNLEGFDITLRKDRTRNSGGIMICVSSLLNYKRRTDLENRRIETLSVELQLKSQIILICC